MRLFVRKSKIKRRKYKTIHIDTFFLPLISRMCIPSKTKKEHGSVSCHDAALVLAPRRYHISKYNLYRVVRHQRYDQEGDNST